MDEQTSTSTQNTDEQTQKSQGGLSFEQFLREAGQVALTVARAAGKAAEDLTGLMVLQVNPEMRARMDDLVEAGLAKTRGEAALDLLREGIRANQRVYEQVEKTRAHIDGLHSQLRGMIGQQS
jgi:hypothetical protein